MKKLLLLFASLSLIAPAANAESYWLIITYGKGGADYPAGLEKVEMESSEACEKEGRKWENSPTQGVKSTHRRFHCVVGK